MNKETLLEIFEGATLAGTLAAVGRYVFDADFSVYYLAAGAAGVLLSRPIFSAYPKAYSKAQSALFGLDPVQCAASTLALFAVVEKKYSTAALLSFDSVKLAALAVGAVWVSSQVGGYFFGAWDRTGKSSR
jgi:hypothetical protein